MNHRAIQHSQRRRRLRFKKVESAAFQKRWSRLRFQIAGAVGDSESHRWQQGRDSKGADVGDKAWIQKGRRQRRFDKAGIRGDSKCVASVAIPKVPTLVSVVGGDSE